MWWSSGGSYPKQIPPSRRTAATAADAEEHKMYRWLSRQLNAGSRHNNNGEVAGVSVGRSRKLKQLSSDWRDTNKEFVF